MFSQTQTLHFFNQLPESTIRAAVRATLWQDHKIADKIRQAVFDDLDETAASYSALPRYVQHIIKQRSRYLSYATKDSFNTMLCYYLTSAIDEFATCLEETSDVFEKRLYAETVLWLAHHNISTLQNALLKNDYTALPFIKKFIHSATAMGGSRGLIISEKYALELIDATLRRLLKLEFGVGADIDAIINSSLKP